VPHRRVESMPVAMRSSAELVKQFRSHGLKATPQRELIFRLLENENSHPTAKELYARALASMPTISLKTVYQVLHDLQELGEVQGLEVGTGATRFQTTGQHNHLVCRGCGTVSDVPTNGSKVILPTQQKPGFAIDEVVLTFRGLCPECQHTDV
jgi:Fur family transcriptional regulator, stress-responsive regulator